MCVFFSQIFSFAKRRKPSSTFSKQTFHSSSRMAGPGTSALLYATVSNVTATAATPESAKDKKHHLEDGKGFVNPWDSWREMKLLQILPEILK